MSLLMDALRKAEQQQQETKRSGPAAAENRAEGLSLEPLTEPASHAADNLAAAINQRLPELPKRLEELDDQFFTSDPGVRKSLRALADAQSREPERPTPALSSEDPASRAAAHNVFAAKQFTPSVGHGFAISVGVATLIAVTAIGAYFYWQLQPKGGLGTGPALSAIPVAPTPPPVAAIAPNAPVAAQASTFPAPVPAPAALSVRTAGADLQTNALKSHEPAAVAGRVPQTAQHAPSAPAIQPDTSIRFSTRTGKIDGTMERAHEAFARGEIDVSRAIWLRALQTDSRNVNALHGLAVIAQQEGMQGQANALYRRVLEVDPKDATAHAALFALNSATDARQAESQLKGMLAEQPGSPQLNFALGNLYAGEARWAEAQQAYFKAHVADAANPDYLYNLAVSLDHLHQNKLAAQYYARALVAAKTQATAFDPAQAEERMNILQSGRAD